MRRDNDVVSGVDDGIAGTEQLAEFLGYVGVAFAVGQTLKPIHLEALADIPYAELLRPICRIQHERRAYVRIGRYLIDRAEEILPRVIQRNATNVEVCAPALCIDKERVREMRCKRCLAYALAAVETDTLGAIDLSLCNVQHVHLPFLILIVASS